MLEPPLNRYGTTLEPVWNHLGNIWNYYGTILEHSGNIVGLPWNYYGNTVNTL